MFIAFRKCRVSKYLLFFCLFKFLIERNSIILSFQNKNLISNIKSNRDNKYDLNIFNICARNNNSGHFLGLRRLRVEYPFLESSKRLLYNSYEIMLAALMRLFYNKFP